MFVSYSIASAAAADSNASSQCLSLLAFVRPWFTCSRACQIRTIYTEISHAVTLPGADFSKVSAKKGLAVSKNKIRRKHIVLAL